MSWRTPGAFPVDSWSSPGGLAVLAVPVVVVILVVPAVVVVVVVAVVVPFHFSLLGVYSAVDMYVSMYGWPIACMHACMDRWLAGSGWEGGWMD